MNSPRNASHVAREKADLLQGTLDLLILKTLAIGPLHGWGVSRRIRALSRDVLEVNQGSLYPALYRLEDRGLIASSWGTSEEGRRVKIYRLTPRGRREFTEEREGWTTFMSAVNEILEAPQS
jgi:transcriptional regulator